MTLPLRRFALQLLIITSLAFGQSGPANGRLQIHFMDVGQGDGAVLISPSGQVVLFDDGALKNCDKPVSYLQQLGVTKIDYHITSHYHSDHIGCASQVFQEIATPGTVLDRGASYASSAYTSYATLSGTHRKQAASGMHITLDQATPHPVDIAIVAVNAKAIGEQGIATTNENDLSVVAVVSFGGFKAEIGGDLSGYKTDNYEDIETSVAPHVAQINVYKVHHHCSRYSTNEVWIATTKPQVGIVSTGNGNVYNHPTAECLERLHRAGVKTYWTENGNGADPDPAFDTVAGNIVLEVAPAAAEYTVSYGTHQDKYPLTGSSSTGTGGAPAPAPVIAQYAWSKKSNVYHFAQCRYVQNISPENLQTGTAPPGGKTLHKDCPK